MASSVGHVKTAEDLTKEEKRNIMKAIKAKKPKSKEEKLEESIAGKPYTTGQKVRGAVVGALGGMGAGSLGGIIQGDDIIPRGSLKSSKAVLGPRRLASGASVGAVYGTIIPAAQRMFDIEAAKKGVY